MPLAILLSLLLIINFSAAHAQSAASPKTLSSPCMTCHGPSGKSTGTIPSLDNLQANRIYQALLAFKKGTRSSTLMSRIAKGYSDKQLYDIAQYISESD